MAPSPQAATAPACREIQTLLEDFVNTMSEYHRMQSIQASALLIGADFPFEEWISNASARMEQTRRAIIAHRLEHGC